MNIILTSDFKKQFSKLPKKIKESFYKRTQLFIDEQSHPLLRVHKLKGNLLGLRAFPVTGDYRVLYKIAGDEDIEFLDIGTHNQVY